MATTLIWNSQDPTAQVTFYPEDYDSDACEYDSCTTCYATGGCDAAERVYFDQVRSHHYINSRGFLTSDDIQVMYHDHEMNICDAVGLLSQNQECRFCHDVGHELRDCPKRKNLRCPACDFIGHNQKKCNKIKRAKDGRVGFCTWKECKGDERWGHWLVTCPKRQVSQGDFEFPPDVDFEIALA